MHTSFVVTRKEATSDPRATSVFGQCESHDEGLAHLRLHHRAMGMSGTVGMLLIIALGVVFVVTRVRFVSPVRSVSGMANVNVVVIITNGMVAMLGVGGGLFTAWALRRVVASPLHELNAADPWTFAGAAVLLSATFIPAVRASRVDPLMVLRPE